MFALEYKSLYSDMLFIVLLWHKFNDVFEQLKASRFFPYTLYIYI